MENFLADFNDNDSVKASIKENWKNYDYFLGRAPSVELSVGKYLTWLITSMPDHFMNLVICTELPQEGIETLIKEALDHFRTLNVRKLSQLAEAGVPAQEIKKHLLANGWTPFQTYLGLLYGEPVATSQVLNSAGVAGIYNVTCLPEVRGRGIGSALVMEPVLAARNIGIKIGVLQSSSMGYNAYRRLGFQDFGMLSVYL